MQIIMQVSMIKKDQVHMMPPKETNRVLITDPKVMEIYELSDK